MDNRTPGRDAVPLSNCRNDGPMQTRKAHFPAADAGRARDIVGEPFGPFEDAPFQPHQLPVMGHVSQTEVEICIDFSAVVVSLARKTRWRTLLGQTRKVFDLPLIGSGSGKLRYCALNQDA